MGGKGTHLAVDRIYRPAGKRTFRERLDSLLNLRLGNLAKPCTLRGAHRATSTCPESCDTISFLPETPSKSLIGDSSVLFSPPSIIRETLPETQDGDGAFGHPPHRPNSSIESSVRAVLLKKWTSDGKWWPVVALE